jgi:ribosomal protein S18 acetylase RimI-like enzyme
MELRRLTTVAEMLAHLSLIRQLTPSLTPGTYRDLLTAMVPHRYAMLAVLEDKTCVGLSGYWIGHKLYCGRFLEIDNFVVDASHRSRGIGKLLVDELIAIAREERCEHVMLDAYLENIAGHRFYERHGFVKRGYHFMRALSRDGIR